MSFKSVCFRYGGQEGKHMFEDINVSVTQGNMVAIVGPQGCGKSLFFQIIAHREFPTAGEVFIPTHLRVLRVSCDPIILKLSAYRNLTFGVPNERDVDPGRVLAILKMF